MKISNPENFESAVFLKKYLSRFTEQSHQKVFLRFFANFGAQIYVVYGIAKSLTLPNMSSAFERLTLIPKRSLRFCYANSLAISITPFVVLFVCVGGGLSICFLLLTILSSTVPPLTLPPPPRAGFDGKVEKGGGEGGVGTPLRGVCARTSPRSHFLQT